MRLAEGRWLKEVNYFHWMVIAVSYISFFPTYLTSGFLVSFHRQGKRKLGTSPSSQFGSEMNRCALQRVYGHARDVTLIPSQHTFPITHHLKDPILRESTKYCSSAPFLASAGYESIM